MENFIKIKLLKLTYCGFILFTFFSCFPSFAPEKKLVKRIENDSEKIEWYRNIGILDQTFPDLIIFSDKIGTDTICRGFNIADVNIINDNITIGFYGKQKIKDDIPLKIRKYDIVIDTMFLRPSDLQIRK